MGMVLVLAAISRENSERILADPLLVWQLLAPDDKDAYAQARARRTSTSWLGSLFGRKAATPKEVPPLQLTDGEGGQVDLDKAWPGLHFLLAGTGDEAEFPAGFLLGGGHEVADEDLGYGPPRILDADAVRQVDHFLDTISEAELRQRYDPSRMRELDIYPEIWGSPHDATESLEYLLEYAETLRGAVRDAESRNLALVLALM